MPLNYKIMPCSYNGDMIPDLLLDSGGGNLTLIVFNERYVSLLITLVMSSRFLPYLSIMPMVLLCSQGLLSGHMYS